MPTSASRTYQSIRMTKVLVLVSTCFLILNAPAHIAIIATKLYSDADAPLTLDPALLVPSNNQTTHQPVNAADLLVLAQAKGIVDDVGIHLMYIVVLLTQYISYASYSINFFLYSFSGVSFRTNLKQWARKIVKHWRQTDVVWIFLSCSDFGDL